MGKIYMSLDNGEISSVIDLPDTMQEYITSYRKSMGSAIMCSIAGAFLVIAGFSSMDIAAPLAFLGIVLLGIGIIMMIMIQKLHRETMYFMEITTSKDPAAALVQKAGGEHSNAVMTVEKQDDDGNWVVLYNGPMKDYIGITS